MSGIRPEKRKLRVPKDALVLDVGTVAFADDPAGDAPGGAVPVVLTARGGDAVEHWFWGRVVHDLAGMRIHKPRLALDYNHDPDRLIGYLDQFDTSGGALVARGALLPGESPTAAEILALARAGVPYEASIFFSGPLRFEELSDGARAKVNGREVTGPATILRQWSLRGVAICPHGVDRDTAARFSAADVHLTILGDTDMSSEIPTPGGAGADPRAEITRYRDAFGENGVTWYLEGKTFAEAQALHAAELRRRADELATKLSEAEKQRGELAERHASAERELAELRARLAEAERARDAAQAKLDALDRGQREPVSFSPAADDAISTDPRAAELSARLGSNLGRFAASLRLPSRNGRGAA